MTPTIGPDVPVAHILSNRGRSTTPRRPTVPRIRAPSGGASIDYSTSRSLPRSSSSPVLSNIGDAAIIRVEGLRHAHFSLEARRYKLHAFAAQLLDIIYALHIPVWRVKELSPSNLSIQKVSGSMTNAVFFVSYPSIPTIPVLLLRIYGPSSGSLISRPRELQTLHILSSRYRIGPQVYGTFENGRIEEYFHSSALTAQDLRDPKTSAWIGARMAELHQVDIDAVEEIPSSVVGVKVNEDHGWFVGAKRNVLSWLPEARDVLALPSVSDSIRRDLDLSTFETQWNDYMHWIDEKEKKEGPSQRVFAHNDTQYGNLLRLTSPKVGTPEHRQIIVVDFEYASPNPAAFDIANHFHEWTVNYHSTNPHVLNPDLYPSLTQRRNFYQAYLSHLETPIQTTITSSSTPQKNKESVELDLQRLDDQVKAWSPASHAMWAIWGIVQAREALEGKDGELEFDYVAYALGRMDHFRRELRALLP